MSETRFSKGDVVPDWILTTEPRVPVTFGADVVVRVSDEGCEVAPARLLRTNEVVLFIDNPDVRVTVIGNNLCLSSDPFYMHRRQRLAWSRRMRGLVG